MGGEHGQSIVISTTVPESIYVLLDEQIKFLLSRNLRITLVTSSGTWADGGRLAGRYNVDVHLLPLKRVVSPVADLAALFKCYRLFRKIRPGVIYACTPKAGLVTILAAYLAGIPFRIYSHWGVYYANAGFLRRKFYSWLDRLICGLSHKVVCMSPSNARYLADRRICDERKLCLLGHGSSHGVNAGDIFNPQRKDPAQTEALGKKYGIKGGDFVVGFVGRLVRDKGIEDLMAAWKEIVPGNGNFHLFLIAPEKEPRDPVSDECYRLIKSLGGVHLVPDLFGDIEKNKNDIFGYYSLFDLLIHPSHREGLPNVVLEAGAMEIPVITTDALGCVDSVEDGVTGIVYPAGNIECMKAGIMDMYHDPIKRRRMGANARAMMLRKYQSRDVHQKLLSLLVSG